MSVLTGAVAANTLNRWVDIITSYLPRAFHPPYLHFTAICSLFFLIALWVLIRRFNGMFDQLRRKWNPPAPYQPGLLVYYRNAVWFWSFVLLIAIAFMAVAFYLSRYQYIGGGVEPAGIAVRHGSTVRFTRYTGGEEKFTVHGSQIAAAGLFLRFPDWMRFVGLATYHRLITFRGMDQNEYHYAKPKADWIKPYADPIYVFLYKNGWFNTYYTESVYFSGGKNRILVTHSGYIVQ
jgi:hypothetical protein